MAKIIINGLNNNLATENIIGDLSITHKAKVNDSGEFYDDGTVTGTLLAYKYIKNISSIESDRIKLNHVVVLVESVGTRDFPISYGFIAYEYEITDGSLSKEKIKEYENNYFCNENNDGYSFAAIDQEDIDEIDDTISDITSDY